MAPIKLPCGSIAVFDTGSGCGHRCTSCFAIVGSVGMPAGCSEAMKKWDTLKLLGGGSWDYSITEEELNEFD